MGREPDLKIGSSLPGIGAGGWRFRRYSTPFEFNNSRNSRQSLFSGIGVSAVAEFDKDTQTLLRGHGRVVARVGLIGVLEAGKYPYRFLHEHIIARWRVCPPCLTPGSSPARFGAPVEQQLPLRPLDLQRLLFFRRPRTFSRLFAVVDEGQRIPVVPERDTDFRRARPQRWKDRVLAYVPEPVPRIPRVGLLPVHQGVPVTSLWGIEILRHTVGLVPARKVEIQPRQHRRPQPRRL